MNVKGYNDKFVIDEFLGAIVRGNTFLVEEYLNDDPEFIKNVNINIDKIYSKFF